MGAALTRRAFLGLCAATAACAGVGGVGAAFAGQGDLLRPPGGQDEAALLGACLKCDRCRSVCPTGAVGLAQVEDGLLRARTPVMDFHRGWCDFCGKCQAACPTGALGAFDPAVDKLGVAVVQPDRCLSYLQTCTSCQDSCGFGALSFNAGIRWWTRRPATAAGVASWSARPWSTAPLPAARAVASRWSRWTRRRLRPHQA